MRIPARNEPDPIELETAAELRRQKRNERIAVAGALIFVCCMIGLVSLTESNPITYTVQQIRRLGAGGGGRAQVGYEKDQCSGLGRDQERICRERDAETESSWRGIVRNEGGKTNAFSVHNK